MVERIVVWLGGLPSTWAIPLVVASVAAVRRRRRPRGQLQDRIGPVAVDQPGHPDGRGRRTPSRRRPASRPRSASWSRRTTCSTTRSPKWSTASPWTPRRAPTWSPARAWSGTIAKIIDIPGATPLAPTSDDLDAAAAVLPPDIEKVLLSPDRTATQINLRLAPASLDERAELVDRAGGRPRPADRRRSTFLPTRSCSTGPRRRTNRRSGPCRPGSPWSASACWRTCRRTAPCSPTSAWPWCAPLVCCSASAASARAAADARPHRPRRRHLLGRGRRVRAHACRRSPPCRARW